MFQTAADTTVEWRDVWLGAILTAALFEVGKFLIGLYIGKQGLGIKLSQPPYFY
jgi:membrane protein